MEHKGELCLLNNINELLPYLNKTEKSIISEYAIRFGDTELCKTLKENKCFYLNKDTIWDLLGDINSIQHAKLKLIESAIKKQSHLSKNSRKFLVVLINMVPTLLSKDVDAILKTFNLINSREGGASFERCVIGHDDLQDRWKNTYDIDYSDPSLIQILLSFRNSLGNIIETLQRGHADY